MRRIYFKTSPQTQFLRLENGSDPNPTAWVPGFSVGSWWPILAIPPKAGLLWLSPLDPLPLKVRDLRLALNLIVGDPGI